MTIRNMTVTFLTALALVLPCRADDVPLHVQIDRHISTVDVAEQSSDAEFLRRVTLDLAGIIPSASETRAFLADSSAEKRATLVDQLLASPNYARRMQQALTVMLLERRAGAAITDPAWNDFLAAAFAANQPWDEFVRELISADGRDARTRPAIRFFVDGGRNDHHQMTRDIARIFLGMNIQCAQCHDHPNVEDFRQAHYFGLFAYLQQTVTKKDTQVKQLYLVENVATAKVDFQSVFFPDAKQMTGPRLPAGEEVDIPIFGKGEELAEPAADGLPGVPKFQPRSLLSLDLSSANNQRFVRNSVNRFWFLMMGRGLVHPLDMMHAENPPSHPELLDVLAADFVASGFDIKHLLREIALSETYQRSSLVPVDVEPQAVPAASYRVSRSRPLSAEQMTYSVLRATGNLQRILAAPVPEESTFTYKDYSNGRIPPPDNLPDVLTLFGATFGNPPGEAEVDFRPSVQQSLFLMNEQLLMHWLEPHDGNLTARLAKLDESNAVLEELYLSVLARLPEADERAIASTFLQEQRNRRTEAIGEIAWSLLTSAEFRLNH